MKTALLLVLLVACGSTSTVTMTASPSAPIPVHVADPACHRAALALLDALQLSMKMNQALFHHNDLGALVTEGRLSRHTNAAIQHAKPCLTP